MGAAKGQGEAPPPPTEPKGMDQNMMMQMMSSMGAMGNQPAMPSLPAMPTLEVSTPVDWDKQTKALQRSARHEYNKNVDARKGRVNTIHSNVDKDEENQGSSLLGE